METLKGIRTRDGLAKIDYEILENKPMITNPNLLDNWYFGNPVNQRGQMEYSSNAYSIDRWLIPSANTVLRLDEFSFYSSASGNIILQYIDNQDEFVGKIVTLSALANNALISTTIEIPDVLPTGTSTIGKGSTPINGVSIYLRVLNSKLAFVFYAASNYIPNTAIKVKAAKLELGDTQTLAHKDANGNWVLNEIPNYADQLARCQRYYESTVEYCRWTIAPNIRITVPYKVTKRVKPAVTVTGSAEGLTVDYKWADSFRVVNETANIIDFDWEATADL